MRVYGAEKKQKGEEQGSQQLGYKGCGLALMPSACRPTTLQSHHQIVRSSISRVASLFAFPVGPGSLPDKCPNQLGNLAIDIHATSSCPHCFVSVTLSSTVLLKRYRLFRRRKVLVLFPKSHQNQRHPHQEISSIPSRLKTRQFSAVTKPVSFCLCVLLAYFFFVTAHI